MNGAVFDFATNYSKKIKTSMLVVSLRCLPMQPKLREFKLTIDNVKKNWTFIFFRNYTNMLNFCADNKI